MSDVKRYEYDDGGMIELSFGDYVHHDDYAALEAERNALHAELAALKAPAVAGDEREVAAVIGFYEGEREPRLLSWNVLPNGEHRLYAAPIAQTPADGLVEALEHARIFIRNGVELGYIQMPDVDTPDPAHETLPKIDAALAAHRAGGA